MHSSQFETLDIDSLQKAQREDTSLKKLWSYAQEASEMNTKGGSKYRYVIQKGVRTESLSKSEDRPQTS